MCWQRPRTQGGQKGIALTYKKNSAILTYIRKYSAVAFWRRKMDHNYSFPAVKGMQARKEYYIAMIPLKMLPELFSENENMVIPEQRAQRKLNETRIPMISRYILDNRDSYVFSALAASIDGKYSFKPNTVNGDTGTLEISKKARFLINDGQHRKAAILNAISVDPSLKEETISIVLYADQGLQRSQQIFTDLNKNAVKTSNSISELYDSRDELAVLTRSVIWKIDFLNKYTDKEKDILGKYSSSLFTLNTFYTANKYIIGKNDVKEYEGFLLHFWMLVTDNMKLWQELQHGEITKVDLRENYIATQNIVIQAFGRVGNYLYAHQADLEDCLKKIEKIDWCRSSKQWYMRAVGKRGRIITNKRAALLIANVIKQETGIPLTQEEQHAEEALKEVVGE